MQNDRQTEAVFFFANDPDTMNRHDSFMMLVGARVRRARVLQGYGEPTYATGYPSTGRDLGRNSSTSLP
eukprot:1221924-Rhodomonas_salina.1